MVCSEIMCVNHNYIVFSTCTELQVGFEATEVEVLESKGTLLLCVNVTQPDNAPIGISFGLEVQSLPGTAGKEAYINSCVCRCQIWCVVVMYSLLLSCRWQRLRSAS